MNSPKHQHFIPQSYLRNFAAEKDNKFFVEAKLRTEEKPQESLISIKDICVNKNIYTIPSIEGDEKYSLERYYANDIDSIFPEVYDLLINPNVTFISSKQRAKIILTTMSLFFRTPKFLNFNEKRLNIVLEYAILNHQDSKGQVKYKFREYNLDFHINKLEEIRTELKIRNKLDFLQSHLKALHEFVKYKLNAGLSVFKIYEAFNLITSDNPVIMHSVAGNDFSLFDPTNIISVPIDNKHFLTIFPNTESSLTDRIFRGDRDKWFALSNNLDVEQNCEEWILGKPGSIIAHLVDQKKYGELNAINLEAFNIMKEKAQDALELSQIVDAVGTFAHQKVANKIKELRKKRIYNGDPEIQKLILELAKHGFLTI